MHFCFIKVVSTLEPLLLFVLGIMKKSIRSLLAHISVFVIIEIIFVLLILHEFPRVSLLSTVWIIHLVYWIVVVIAGIARDKIKPYRWKFLATYLPVLLHISWHIYVVYLTVDTVMHDGKPAQRDNLSRLMITTIGLWVLIFFGERLLHKKQHCDSCHAETHKKCSQK